MALFERTRFTSAAGLKLSWKIECDALTEADWETIAELVGTRLSFGTVEGVPEGGLAFAEMLEPYATGRGLLIVDDVYTTGQSMENHRSFRPAQGVVLFARGLVDLNWVQPIFRISEWMI